MEDSREATFMEIQKIVDSCITHDYAVLTDALMLKCEYLTEAQFKEYLRQEISRIAEEVVTFGGGLCSSGHC